MTPEYLTPRDAGAMLGVKERTLVEWRRTGRGPKYIRLGGLNGRVRYQRSELAAFMQERMRRHTAEESVCNAAPSRLPEVEGLVPLPIVPQSGVYFLCCGDEVVYVGQSHHPAARIRQHNDKTFDRAFMLPVPPERLREVEAAFIQAMRPRLQIALTGEIEP